MSSISTQSDRSQGASASNQHRNWNERRNDATYTLVPVQVTEDHAPSSATTYSNKAIEDVKKNISELNIVITDNNTKVIADLNEAIKTVTEAGENAKKAIDDFIGATKGLAKLVEHSAEVELVVKRGYLKELGGQRVENKIKDHA